MMSARLPTAISPRSRSPTASAGVLVTVRTAEARSIAGTSRGKETFFDGKVFDPEKPGDYLASLSIKRPAA